MLPGAWQTTGITGSGPATWRYLINRAAAPPVAMVPPLVGFRVAQLVWSVPRSVAPHNESASPGLIPRHVGKVTRRAQGSRPEGCGKQLAPTAASWRVSQLPGVLGAGSSGYGASGSSDG